MTPAKHLCRHINNTFSLCASVFTNLPGNSFSSWRQDEITLCSSSPSIRREFTTFPLMFCGETTQTVTQVSRKSFAAPSWPQLRFTVSLISSTCFRCTLTDVFVQRRTVQMSMSMCDVRRCSSSLSGVPLTIQTSLFSISITLSSEALMSSCSDTQGL